MTEFKLRTFDSECEKSSYFPDSETSQYWIVPGIVPPLITRQLDQEDIHQMVKGLVSDQDSNDDIVIYTNRDWISINLTGDVWILRDHQCSVESLTYADVEEVLNLQSIKSVQIYRMSDDEEEPSSITVYDSSYPFFRSPDQKAILERCLPNKEFDYPKEKIPEADYLKQLGKENQQLKERLTEFLLTKDISKIVQEYVSNPDLLQRYLESKFPNAALIGSYL